MLHTAHVDVLLGCAGSECRASIRGTGDPPTCLGSSQAYSRQPRAGQCGSATRVIKCAFVVRAKSASRLGPFGHLCEVGWVNEDFGKAF